MIRRAPTSVAEKRDAAAKESVRGFHAHQPGKERTHTEKRGKVENVRA